MVNTPRDGSAYILVGVQERSGKVSGIPGVADHPDEAELGRIVSARLDPAPRFSYRQVPYGDVEIGLIDIPCDQPVPVLPRNNYGVLRRNSVYIRRNTQNTEADREDLARIHQWRQPEPSTTLDRPSGSWEQLYRACDGFDPGRTYVAVLDRDSSTDARDWTAMASIHWSTIVDFDAGTDTDGNYAIAEGQFSGRQALHLSALDDSPSITGRSSVWIAASGLDSRPTTGPSATWREWNRSKGPRLEQVMNELARVTEPKPVTVVVFGGESTYVSTTCDIVDRAFAERVGYVIANPDLYSYEDIRLRFDASAVAITLPDVCQGLRELRPDHGPVEETLFPKLGNGTVAMAPNRARWVEEQLELVHWDAALSSDHQDNEDSFLKGATVSWSDLDTRVDADRDITIGLEHQIRRELEERAIRRVNLWHWPGAGASTVARRIAWNIHRQFPTVVARDIHPQQTAERLRHLFGITRLPVLAIIDLPGTTKEVVDRLYDELRGSHVPAVLFNVVRSFDTSGRHGSHYIDAMLTTREANRLSRILVARVPSRQSNIESLIDEDDRRKRTPFYFGLVAYGRQFRGLESYVSARLTSSSDAIQDVVLMMAFAYYYGQVTLSLQIFGPIFNIPVSKLVTTSNVIPDHMRELLVEVDDSARPAHYLIAEEILQQALGQKGGDRRNWPVELADLAIRFIDLLADLPHRGRGAISDTIRAVFIERGSTESPAGPWETEFSQLLADIPSVEGMQRVLEHLADAFPEEPHFWAHLGRFYSRLMQDHAKAHRAYESALELSPNDSLLHHMAGMGWRNELYDLLASIARGVVQDNESQVLRLVENASMKFEAARALDRRSEYSYISQIQMIHRVVGTISSARGYRYDAIRFLALRGNDPYRELVDDAQNLLSDLALIKGTESSNELQVRVQADLAGLHGKHSEAIVHLTNVLDRRESHKPPVRRAIIRAYIAKHKDDWSLLSDREVARVVELAGDNITEEPGSDYNLRLWLRAVRIENSLNIDRVAEQLAYKRLQNPSVDTTYYLYIMKLLQLEAGDLVAARQIPPLIEECGRLARDLSRTENHDIL